jgi:signal transduction histidine kinase
MSRRALRGVQELTRTAAEIADGALDRRVVVRSQGDEIDTLARTFNTMLDRIHALIIGMREMTDNLAHDLRSPLGRIRASAEMILISGGSKAEAEAMVATTAEECDRLLEMINTTLDIAEAESGAAKLKLAEFDWVELVGDAVELFQPLAEDKQVTIAVDLPNDCRIRGDRQRLQRVVANLLDNAVKYTPSGGGVTIKLDEEGERLKLSIQDTGVGISPSETARIFERFYRCNRSRSELGNGLGLSLALAFVRVHGGDIVVDSTPERGSMFTVVLPRLLHV